MPHQTPPWNSLSAYWRECYGERVQKIPLDAELEGVTCPNRDGTLSRSGCAFCNAAGSGSGLGARGMSLLEQWEFWRAHFQASSRTRLFMAYVQSFTNTYGPAERLAGLLAQVRDLPGMVGMSIGTRPDCVDAAKVALLASMSCHEVWLELGVQSFDNATLERINRGHDAAASEQAIRLAAAAGLKVCVHLMVGLPGEDAEDFLHSLRCIMKLPVHGIKLHNVYVCPNTALAREYLAGTYTPMTREAYIDLAVLALKELTVHRPDMVVHRVVADTVPDDLLAPSWVLDKHPTMMAIQKAMRSWRVERTPDPTPPV